MTAAPLPPVERYINRELSWLAFNERVLEEATDAAIPLLERAKFASIVASNLDEFFMVRVANLRHEIADHQGAPDLTGMTPVQQMAAVAVRAHATVDALYRLAVDELLPALARAGVRLPTWDGLDAGQAAAREVAADLDRRERRGHRRPVEAARPLPRAARRRVLLRWLARQRRAAHWPWMNPRKLGKSLRW